MADGIALQVRQQWNPLMRSRLRGRVDLFYFFHPSRQGTL